MNNKNKHKSMIIKFLITFAILLIGESIVLAAPISNLPTILTQPNGEELNLFVSGDEYFNYIHDANGNIIIKNYDTGYYTYATVESDIIVASDDIVSAVASISENEQLETITFDDIPKTYIKSTYENSYLNNISGEEFTLSDAGLINDRKQHRFLNKSINNIVIFIDFPDVAFNKTYNANYYNGILNSNEISLKNWYDTSSYGKTGIVSHIYPEPNDNMLIKYTDIHSRDVYLPVEYKNDGTPVYKLNGKITSELMLENDLLERALKYVAEQIPQDLNIDVDGDGYVDSITFIIAGKNSTWSSLLWSHSTTLSRNVKIHGKSVKNYIFVMEEELGINSRPVSVLTHEMFHLYGAPDLYHYYDDSDSVGSWDIMCGSNKQMPSMYMKYKYGNWINSIPEITDDTLTYTINKNTLPTNNCYILRSPYSSNEFFVVEYRKKEYPFEDGIPGSGIVIYRIDSRFSGNADYDRDKILDEVFVSQVPSPNEVYYPNYGDTAILTLSDGSSAGIKLAGFVLNGDSASFEVEFCYTKPLGFMDPRILTAISKKVGKDVNSLTSEDLAQITDLTINGVGDYYLPIDLSGIEQLTNLEVLVLNRCKLHDITSLGTLSKLTYLELKNNNITDFSALKNLSQLTHLKIRGNLTDDYSAVSLFYENIKEKDFSFDTTDEIVFGKPYYNDTNNIENIPIICSNTSPDSVYVVIDKYSEDNRLMRRYMSDYSLTVNDPQVAVSSYFGFEEDSYITVTAYERADYSKTISKSIIYPAMFDLAE